MMTIEICNKNCNWKKFEQSPDVICISVIVQLILELEAKVVQRFAKVSIVSYSRPSLMIIALAPQFHVYLPRGQHLFSMVSS